jgi:hypothetical protein
MAIHFSASRVSGSHLTPCLIINEMFPTLFILGFELSHENRPNSQLTKSAVETEEDRGKHHHGAYSGLVN